MPVARREVIAQVAGYHDHHRHVISVTGCAERDVGDLFDHLRVVEYAVFERLAVAGAGRQRGRLDGLVHFLPRYFFVLEPAHRTALQAQVEELFVSRCLVSRALFAFIWDQLEGSVDTLR